MISFKGFSPVPQEVQAPAQASCPECTKVTPPSDGPKLPPQPTQDTVSFSGQGPDVQPEPIDKPQPSFKGAEPQPEPVSSPQPSFSGAASPAKQAKISLKQYLSLAKEKGASAEDLKRMRDSYLDAINLNKSDRAGLASIQETLRDESERLMLKS
jgi:hypothetical protein